MQGLVPVPAVMDHMQAVLHCLQVNSAGAAVQRLRQQGELEFGKRVQRLSKCRNSVAHPDEGLLDDVKMLM
eukprot:5912935-Prorocentrum_lima.AAC.1